jgi:hypothetical protein
MKILLIPLLTGALLLSGCVSTPQTRTEENPDLFESFTAAQKETILKGEVDLDFTEEMVLMAAGAPDRKAKKRSKLGTTEVWTYYKFRARPISGYGYGGYNGYFSYNRRYGSWVRSPFYDDFAVVRSYGEPEKNLVVDFQEGKVISFEMVQ